MAQTKIRLPQLNAESLTENSTTALVFKEQGVAAAYLTFDTDTSKIDLGDGAVSVKLSGELTGTSFKTENNMASNSATSVASQASIKAYVDAQVTLQDMDIASDSGTIDVDLDSETLTVAGGEGIDTSASGTTITIAMELATTADVGGASFSSADFAVSGAGAVTVKTAGILTAQIADDQITAALMADESIDSDMYVNGSIDEVHLSDDSVDSRAYVNGSIDEVHLSDDSVDSRAYVDGSIDLIHMSADSVDSPQYVDASVDFVHLQDVTANSLLIRNAGTSGVLSELALATTQIMIGDGTGMIAAALSGDATMSSAGVVTVTQSAGDFLVTGDLNVQGDRNIMNTKHVTFEDVSLTLALPGGMKDATFAYTHAGTLVTVASTGHGFVNGEFVYFQHDVGTPLFTEEVYAVTRVDDNSFTLSATSTGAADLAALQSCMHSGTKILDAGSDGAGIKIPRASAAGMPQISWSDSGDKFQVKSADLEVLEDLTVAGLTTLSGNVSVNGNVLPDTDNTDNLGSDALSWAAVYADAFDLNGNTGGLVLDTDGNTKIYAAADDSIDFSIGGTDTYGMIAAGILPVADGTKDLGASGAQWKDIYIHGKAYIDQLGEALDCDNQAMTNVNIDSGDISAATISGGLTWSAAQNLNSQVLTGVNIDSGDISAATISGGLTWSAAQNLNSQVLTGVNIDGGTVDGVVIGGASAAAGTFTTLACTAKALDAAALNINARSAITLALADELVVQETTGGNDIKKTTMGAIQTFLAGGLFEKAVGVIGVAGITAGNLCSGVAGFPSLSSGLLANVNGATADATKTEVYLNGMLLAKGANSDYSVGSTFPAEDYAYDTDAAAGSPAPGLIFSMDLEVGDQIAIMSRP
jgi:hypothetical protein